MERFPNLAAIFAIVLLGLSTAGSARAASEDAVAYRSTAAHTGQQTMPDFVQPVGLLWDAALPGTILYYPIVAGGNVFVIVTDQNAQGAEQTCLYALSAKNGTVAWGPVVLPSGTFSFAGDAAATYDNGTVFVAQGETTSEGGLMLAYNASTGAEEWSTSYGGQWWSNDFPTAQNGYVYVQEAGNVSCVRESDGNVMWTTSQLETEMGALAVSGTNLYISGAGGDSFSLNESNGAVIWPLYTGVEGGGGFTCAYDSANNILFIRDYYDPNQFAVSLGAALNGSTGSVLEEYTDIGDVAIDDGMIFGVNSNNAVVATKESNWANAWTASNGTDLPVTSPTVVNGTVYVGTDTGYLNGYDEQTGAQTVSIALGETPTSNEYWGGNDMAAGDGIIVIPAGTHLVAVGTPFATLTLSLNPATPNGTNGWYTTPVTATVTSTAGTIHYSIDGGAAAAYSSPVKVSGDAKHTFTYWATDSSGDSTIKQNATIMIDSTPPVTTGKVSGTQLASGAYAGSAVITLSATDNLSGVASTHYSIDGGATTAYSTPITIQTAGSHTVTYHSTDMAGNVEQTDTITLSVGPPILHTFQPGLQMISCPQDDSAVSLADTFDISPVKLAWWNPANSTYVMTPNPPANALSDGTGYWVRFTTAANLLSVGQPTDTNSDFQKSLSAGWNMIGDPWSYAVASDILTVTDSSGNSFPVGQAGSLVSPTLYTYQAGDTAYETLGPGATIQPFEGYWIFAYVPCTLVFPGSPGAPPNSPFVRHPAL